MKQALKNIFFAVIAIVIFFALLEGGTRLARWFKEDQMQSIGKKTLAFDVDDLNPYVFFRSLPSLELRPDDNYFYKFDEKEITAKKTPEEYRIFVMGGSVARGYGASAPEKKFYHIFERLLNENRPESITRRFNVISAGRLGYVSAQELILLLMGVLDFHPDLVIHLNGFNDVLSFTQYKELPGHPIYFQSLVKALKGVKAGQTVDRVSNRSAFFSEVKKMIQKYKTSSSSNSSINIARHYERNMRHISQILSANQIKGYLILQPLIYDKKNKSQSEEKQIKEIGSTRPILFTSLQMFAESLALIGKEEDIHWGNFRGVFEDFSETVFVDTVHLNDKGQEILARALWKEIKPIVYNELPAKD